MISAAAPVRVATDVAVISPVVALLIVFKSLAATEPVSVIVTSSFPKLLIPLDAVFISAAIAIVSTVDAFTDPGTLLSTTFNTVAVIVVSVESLHNHYQVYLSQFSFPTRELISVSSCKGCN